MRRYAAVAPDQSVVINSRAGGITRAFNPDGTDKWTYSSGGEIFGGPTIDPATGSVFIANDNGVVALQPNGTNTPNVLWNYSAGFNAQTVTPAFDPARNLVSLQTSPREKSLPLTQREEGHLRER